MFDISFYSVLLNPDQPGELTRDPADPGAGPVRVCQKTGQCNDPVDPAGQPMTWATRVRTGQDPVCFFFKM